MPGFAPRLSGFIFTGIGAPQAGQKRPREHGIAFSVSRSSPNVQTGVESMPRTKARRINRTAVAQGRP